MPNGDAKITRDPLTKASYLDWFNQIEHHYDEQMATAYQAYYGRPFDHAQGSATEAWVKAFTKNGPLPTTDSDGPASEAVGAPGQKEPFMGLISTAKYRDVAKGKLHMAICTGMQPFVGLSTPAFGLISTKTKEPECGPSVDPLPDDRRGYPTRRSMARSPGMARFHPTPKRHPGCMGFGSRYCSINPPRHCRITMLANAGLISGV